MEQQPTGGFNGEAGSEVWPAGGPGDLAHDSAGQVQPRYQAARREAGRLACGELVLEPVLGPVRVTSVTATGSDPALVAIGWRDDRGPCRAVGRYPAEHPFLVRVPHRDDVQFVWRGINQATWHRREVSDSVARLIAAHTHFGPRSALHSFAVSGRIWDDLYDELEVVAEGRPRYLPWVTALVRHCLARDDTGPVPGWGPAPPEPAVDQPDPDPVSTERRAKAARPRPATGNRVSMETALQLMDAAYALGVAASRPDLSIVAKRRLIELNAGTRL